MSSSRGHPLSDEWQTESELSGDDDMEYEVSVLDQTGNDRSTSLLLCYAYCDTARRV